MTLRRLILEFTRDGIQARVLYRSKDGPMAYTAHGTQYAVDSMQNAPHVPEEPEKVVAA